jgi:hypothetical protein
VSVEGVAFPDLRNEVIQFGQRNFPIIRRGGHKGVGQFQL